MRKLVSLGFLIVLLLAAFVAPVEATAEPPPTDGSVNMEMDLMLDSVVVDLGSRCAGSATLGDEGGGSVVATSTVASTTLNGRFGSFTDYAGPELQLNFAVDQLHDELTTLHGIANNWRHRCAANLQSDWLGILIFGGGG